jgi:tRNA threonylcarbamoyladenosine modification (KEOPS) complex  Pcc1 subunit
MELNLSIPFPGQREANIAYDALRVEVEPARSHVTRTMSVDGSVLSVHLKAETAKSLRVSVNALLEHLVLVTQTIQEFGPPL